METSGPPQPAARPGALPVPTTFAGVAAVAGHRARWLVFWQVLVAATSALVAAWALQGTWGGAVRRAAEALPAPGEIRDGRLYWQGETPAILHHGPFLSLVVDPAGLRGSALTADVTLSLEEQGLGVRSIFGWANLPYPPELQVRLERLELTGVLAAWTGPVLLWSGGAIFVGLFLSWAALATVYGTVLWALAGFLGRTPSYGVAWRLAGASLLPGAVLLAAAIGLYASRQLGFLGLLFAFPLHVAVGWVYCLGGLARLRKPAANPFHRSAQPAQPNRATATGDPQNPFQTP